MLAVIEAAPVQATPLIWESNFGAAVVAGDDSTANVNFGFNFGFLGNTYANGEVSTNGFLSLGGSNGDGCCDANVGDFLAGNDRIAPAWFDFVGTVFLNTSVADRAVLTWQGAEFSNSTQSTFQVQLFNTGQIIFGYDNLAPLEDPGGHRHHGLTGVTGGGGSPDPGEINYSTALLYNSGASGSVYEFFDRGPNGATGGNPDTWDLAQSNLCFSPNGNGGWTVDGGAAGCESAAAVPEPGTLTLLGGGIVAAVCSIRRRRSAR